LVAANDFLSVAEYAARTAGKLLRDWTWQLDVREKGPSDLVTAADVASQELIQKILLGAFPSHGFLGEEKVSIAPDADGYRWIVDPLDGTTNYVRSIPAWAVSVALEQRGRIVAGVVYDPCRDECFTATAGGGAWLNGKPMRASGVERLEQAVVAMSLPAAVTDDAPALHEFCAVVLRAGAMRRIGSAALNLCYLAAGRFDAYWSSHTRIWDIAAGVLLATEAGATVTGRSGKRFDAEQPGFVAASTAALHCELFEALGGAHGSA
jgi:myo-inositol-1(or 4)-monophosphatase